MAGLSVGRETGARSRDHELPLVPMIDFMLCLVMFLLVTAVWSHMARLPSDATRGPGSAEGKPTELHVAMRGDGKFDLTWKQGQTVIQKGELVTKPVARADASLAYPELGNRILSEWKHFGVHRNPSDQRLDRAVLHTQNGEDFNHIVGVLDALNAPARDIDVHGTAVRMPAFSVTFAAN